MDWVQSIRGLSNHPKTITWADKNLLFLPIGAKWKVSKPKTVLGLKNSKNQGEKIPPKRGYFSTIV